MISGASNRVQRFGLDTAVIPLKGWDYDALRQNNFNASLTASRISLDAQHRYGNYNSYAYFELDFAGATHAHALNNPSNATSAMISGVRTTNSYTPRIRHAYGEITDNNKENTWLVGQTWTNFATPEVNAWSTNNLWPSFRTAQIRFTRKIVSNFTASIALEKPNTQTYYFTSPSMGSVTGTIANNIASNYVDNDSTAAFNKSSLPDLTFQGKYQNGLTQFALRAVLRRLEIKAIGNGTVAQVFGQSNNANSFSSKKNWVWFRGICNV
jgi:hypothetical protein